MQLPMFPLGTTLVPGQVIPLRVFEPRYVAMVEACVASDRCFGLVLIERGSEVGGGDSRFDVGTLAVIEDLTPPFDGEYAFAAVGRQRVRVSQWLPDDPYPRAEVQVLEDEGPVEDAPKRVAQVLGALRRVLTAAQRLGYEVPDIEDLGDDPMAAAWSALIVAGVGALDVQRVLEIDDATGRIDAVIAALADAAELLELRAE